jgi:mycothiol synthase
VGSDLTWCDREPLELAPMVFRPAVLDDAAAVLELCVARDLADIGTADWTLGDLLDQWRRSDVDLGTDALVAEPEHGTIVGYALIIDLGAQVLVAPDHEGRGIGTRLRRWAEQHDRDHGRTRHSQWVAAGNERARSHLVDAGYEPVRTYWRMGRTLDSVGDPQPPPPGVRLRPLDPQADADVLYALNEASFAGNADYRSESLQAFREEHLGAHDLDPRLSCIAECDRGVVGFLLARRWRERPVGFIDLLGVHPDHRRRGLARAMLTDAFAGFAAAGLRDAQLGVAADNPGALSLYEQCGMTPRSHSVTYERRVVT